MPGLHVHGAEEVRAACQAGRASIAKAFGRAFDGIVELTTVETFSADDDKLADGISDVLSGPGLLFAFPVGDAAAVAALPECSGLVPGWCADPDVIGRGKLKTLALELGSMLFPASQPMTDCMVTWISELGAGLRGTELAADCAWLTVGLAHAGKSGTLSVAWPAARGEAMKPCGDREPAAAGESASAPGAGTSGAGIAPRPTRPPIRYGELEEGIRLLPAYARSLLKILVPVTVILAESKQSLHTVLNIGPGSIIHFNKSCDDTLTLEISGHKFAVGETVKVGDKFGLWITSIVMPDERFWVIGNRQSVERAK